MNIAQKFGDWVWSAADTDPEKSLQRIILGLRLQAFRMKHFAPKEMPKAYRYINDVALRVVADALAKPDTLAYTNIFTPAEILECFGLTSVSMECLASYLSGFFLEDRILDQSEADGISSTMCSYHRNFIGAMDKGLMPRPRFAVTTSMVCDGNIATFRRMEEYYGIRSHVIDVPYTYSKDAEYYVVSQLEDMIQDLETLTGRKLNRDELSERIERENRTKEHYLSFLQKRRTKAFPNTLTTFLFQLFASHLNIGTEWAEDFFRMMDEEIDSYPDSDQLRLFWIHVPPYCQQTLTSYLNYGREVAISGGDFDLDYSEHMDPDHPLEAIARKMILNIYNGPHTRKMDAIEKMVKNLQPDGVVEYTSWGCRQSSGGANLTKQRLLEDGFPMLILDGDPIDRRNMQDGQIRTRFEAFLEILKNERNEKR